MGTSDVRDVGLRLPGAMAAEIGTSADPGELLVNSVVAELAAGSGLTLEPRGEHRLRGDDAVRLLAHTAGLH